MTVPGTVLRLPLILAACAAVAAAGLLLAPVALVRALTVSGLILLGFPLGAITIMLAHALSGGAWGEALRPVLRTMAAALPLALALLLPGLVFAPAVFPWAGDPAALSETVRLKLPYLNLPFFAIRFAACGAVWLVLAWLLGAWPGDEDKPPSVRLGVGGLVAQALALHFFTTDWMMSLEPEFYSTIYPMMIAASQAVGSLALALLLLGGADRLDEPGGQPDTPVGEDLAKMLFGFITFWAYLAFMQWLIIWSGDLPHEIGWYLRRGNGIWRVTLWAIIALAAVIPICAFLGNRAKRQRPLLMGVVAAALAGQVLNQFWTLMPAFDPGAAWLWLLPGTLLPGAAGAWLSARWLVAGAWRRGRGTAHA